MAVQRVIQSQRHFLRVERQHPIDLIVEPGNRQIPLAQPANHCLPEQIIHRRVKAVGCHQLLCVTPCFTQEQGIWLELLDAR